MANASGSAVVPVGCGPRDGQRPRALAILGMHRSGTSAVTRAFNLLGAWLGEEGDLMPASADNPEGFWERNDIYGVHERLLVTLGRRWDCGIVLPRGWHRSPEAAPHREELKRIVATAFAGRPLWAWKDPRTCLLMDLWVDLLEELQTGLAAVFVARHPADVAASLRTRDGFGEGKAWGLWLGHTLAALHATSGVPTAVIAYERFLEDPAGAVRRCAATLGIPWPDDDGVLEGRLGGAVRRTLCHSSSGDEALAGLPRPVRELYGLLSSWPDAAGPPEALRARVAELHREFEGYGGLFREDFGRLVAADRSLVAARARIAAAEELAGAAEAAAAEARGLLRTITSSRSWRITAPLRALHDRLRAKRGD